MVVAPNGATQNPTDYEVRVLEQRLRALGVSSDVALESLVRELKILAPMGRGVPALGPFAGTRNSIWLLTGIACLFRLPEDGTRQITSLYFGGDVLNLDGFGSFQAKGLELAALTRCVFGTIDFDVLNEQLARHPSLALALWRATMLEMSVSRQWLVNATRKPAEQRVAHLICEIICRQEASGTPGLSIPITQLDIADAVGLSPVHVNRTFQVLRAKGVLSDRGRIIQVTNRKKLEVIGEFDDRYLKITGKLAQWDVKMGE